MPWDIVWSESTRDFEKINEIVEFFFMCNTIQHTFNVCVIRGMIPIVCNSIWSQVSRKETRHQYEIMTRIDVVFELFNRRMFFELTRNHVMIFHESSNIHTNLKMSSEHRTVTHPYNI
jgi:hypothetical protein